MRKGWGVERDYVKARELYEQASKAGSAGGTYRLALLYRGGLGTPQADVGQCVRLCEEAARMGSARAMNNLAFLLQTEGESEDLERAAGLFEQAAKMGHLGASYNLAISYRDGNGVPKNEEMAYKYYKDVRV